jgi:hypothetical protein
MSHMYGSDDEGKTQGAKISCDSGRVVTTFYSSVLTAERHDFPLPVELDLANAFVSRNS